MASLTLPAPRFTTHAGETPSTRLVWNPVRRKLARPSHCSLFQPCSAISSVFDRSRMRWRSLARARKMRVVSRVLLANSRFVHASFFCRMRVCLSGYGNVSRAFEANSLTRYWRSGSGCTSLSSTFVLGSSAARSWSPRRATSPAPRFRNVINASLIAMRSNQVENCEFPSNC